MNQEEYTYWRAQALSARRTQLETVRKSATAWSALLTAVLGAFGTATFVTGLPGLDELSDTTADSLRVAVLLIAGLLLVAVVLAGLASTSFPKLSNEVTADNLRTATKKRAVSSRFMLAASVAIGSLAAALLVVGSAVVLFADKSEEPAKGVTVLVTTAEGTFCGKLEAGDGALVVDGHQLIGVTNLVTVTSCPADG